MKMFSLLVLCGALTAQLSFAAKDGSNESRGEQAQQDQLRGLLAQNIRNAASWQGDEIPQGLPVADTKLNIYGLNIANHNLYLAVKQSFATAKSNSACQVNEEIKNEILWKTLHTYNSSEPGLSYDYNIFRQLSAEFLASFDCK